MVEEEKGQTTGQRPREAGKFLRFSLIYGLGDLLAKGARIVLIPFYLSVMTQAEVGELYVLQAIIFATWTLLGFGLAFSVQKYYHEYTQRGSDQGDAMVSSIWLARMIAGLPFYGLLMLAAYYFHHHSGNSIALDLLYLAVTAGFLKGGINIVEFWLNIREEPVKYRAFTFSQFLLTTLLIIYLVVFQKLGVKGAILGELISYSIFVLISAFMLFRRAMPNLRQVNWRQAFGYCLPVLPHAFFMWGLTGIDRLLLNGSVDRAQIGVYSIGFLLGSFLSIVVRSMRAAWLPAYFKNANDPDSQQQFGKIASIYLFLTFLTALGGMCFAAEVVWLFSLTSAASYSESAKIMQLVLFGFVNMALFIALNQPLLFERRTGLLSMISGFGLAINICLNLLLIPQLGIWGAAIANVSAYLAMTAVTFAATNRIYKIEWESGPLLLTICLFVVFGAVACQFPAEVNMRLIPLKLVLLVAFPLLTLFRFRSSKQALITIESRFAWTQFKPRTFPRSA